MKITLHNLPIVASILKNTDLVAENEGMIAVMKMIVAKTGGKLAVKNKSADLDTVLGKKPVLVICNHPAQADVPILLSALAARNDAYIIASHHFLNILPSVDKNVIPVYISHRELEKNDWKFKLLNKINPVKIPERDEAHQKNIESISQATDKINNGGLVVIFPAAEEINNQFMPGVGHIIKKLDYPAEVNVVMAFIEGTSVKDYLRLIPFLGRILPEIKLTFSKVYRAAEFWDDNARISAKNLEKKYYGWIDSLKNQFNKTVFLNSEPAEELLPGS